MKKVSMISPSKNASPQAFTTIILKFLAPEIGSCNIGWKVGKSSFLYTASS